MANNKSNYQVGFVFNAKKASSFNRAFGGVGKAVDDVGSKIKTVTKGIGTLATVIGASFGAGAAAKTINDYSKSVNGFASQTGIAVKDMSAYEKIIQNIYGQGLGDNINEISNAMALVYQQTGFVGTELENATKNAIIMNDTFGMDINETIRATNALTKQFGINSDQAYNLLAQGAQKGLNQNQDLTDIISEYAVYFKTMGFTSDEMFNSLVSGASNGAYTIDYLADAMKEFGIRVKDDSKTTTAAFDALGLDGDKLAKDFANGGDSAQEAFKLVTDTLFSLEDNVMKNQIGVSLFGTKFEDLEASAVQALTNTQGEINKTKNTMQDIVDIKYDDIGNALERVGRKLNTKLILPIGKKLIPHIEKGIDKIDSFSDTALKALDAVGKALTGDIRGVVLFEELFGGDKAKAKEAFDVVKGIGEDIKWAWERAKEFGGYIADNWPTILPVLINIGKAFVAWKIGKTAIGIGKFGLELAKMPKKIAQSGLVKLAKGKDSFETVALKSMYAKDKIVGFAKGAGSGIGKLAKGAGKGILGLGKAFIGFATSPVGLAVLAVGALIAAGVLLYKNWDTVKAKAIELWESFKTTFAPVGEFFSGIWDSVTGTFKGFINGIIDGVNFATSAINKLSFTVPDWVPGIGGQSVGFDIKQIPHFANGAIVKRATTAVVGEAGTEAILPLKGSKSAGILQRAIQPVINNLIQPKYALAGFDGGLQWGKLSSLIQSLVNRTRGGGLTEHYHFSPIIYAEGKDKSEIRDLLNSQFRSFKAELERERKSRERDERRRSYE